MRGLACDLPPPEPLAALAAGSLINPEPAGLLRHFKWCPSLSRSRRKTPISGITTADSDHIWKKMAARKLRHRVKQHLNATLDGNRFAGKRWDLVNPWSSEKDGKHWMHGPDPRWMRK